jgi:farnesyl diphosphate synthase
VADDIMDASPTRRGQPCWYKLPKVGMVAINDAFVLQSHLYKLLKAHFSGTPALYLQLVELFLETTWRTELGQQVRLQLRRRQRQELRAASCEHQRARKLGTLARSRRVLACSPLTRRPSRRRRRRRRRRFAQMDLTSSPTGAAPGTVDLERFTLARYEAIVKHKTAYYSFYLPIACGLCLAGLGGDARALADAEAICVAMGEYFQIQDDVLDAFAPPEVLGKVGTDIQDAKCACARGARAG